MARAQLTRSIDFPAGHRYYRSEWSAQENAGERAIPTTENLGRVPVRQGRDLWSDYCG